ncbi:MAG: hypothetical protein H5T62_18350 [Anaerolineae bacterium]|nr:hypothetical protein [Anaerolineae bacterium]
MKNDREFEAVLDRCLADMGEGRATIEELVVRYPQYARRLEPLLRTGQRIISSGPQLSDEVASAIQERLLRRAAELEGQRRAPRPRRSLFSWLLPRFRLMPAVLVLLIALLVSGLLVSPVAAASLPGDVFYPVKRAAERVQLGLTFSELGRVRLHIQFAERRLEEVLTLLEQRGQLDEATLAEVGTETDVALTLAEQLGDERDQVLTTLAALTERQQAVLAEVKSKAPPQAQAGLSRAMERSRRGHERAQAALEGAGKKKKDQTATPRPTYTPRPTHTPKPTQEPKATHTPKPKHTPKPTHTPRPTKSHPGGKPATPQGNSHR